MLFVSNGRQHFATLYDAKILHYLNSFDSIYIYIYMCATVGNPPGQAQRSPRTFGPGTPKESEKSPKGCPGGPGETQSPQRLRPGVRKESKNAWSAANGGLRDGGLRKSEENGGKRPFSSVFWIFQVLFRPSGKGRKRQKKGDFGRFRPISGKGGQTPLKPPFVTPPFAAAQNAASDFFLSEPFAMGPVQFRRLRGVAENWFTQPGFWEHSVSFPRKKQQNTEFTKFFSVRTPEIY